MSPLMQAILIGLIYWAISWNFGYTFLKWEPVIVAWFIGMIYGNVPQAMIIGATIELIYIGMIAPGANIPADGCLASFIAIPIALRTNMTPEMAVALAVPFGILGVAVDYVRRTINAAWVHMADKYAEDANVAGIYKAAYLWPCLSLLPLKALPVALAAYLGPDAVTAVLNAIPQSVLHGLEVTGGALPALGFAITMMVIGRKNLLPYFLLGFFLTQYANLNIMAAAIFGTLIALLHIQFTGGVRSNV